jgi:hypothetical protein
MLKYNPPRRLTHLRSEWLSSQNPEFQIITFEVKHSCVREVQFLSEGQAAVDTV